ncbi:MAG: hypothetical protein AAGA27_07925 [Pseudomonadota bacterium]
MKKKITFITTFLLATISFYAVSYASIVHHICYPKNNIDLGLCATTPGDIIILDAQTISLNKPLTLADNVVITGTGNKSQLTFSNSQANGSGLDIILGKNNTLENFSIVSPAQEGNYAVSSKNFNAGTGSGQSVGNLTINHLNLKNGTINIGIGDGSSDSHISITNNHVASGYTLGSPSQADAGIYILANNASTVTVDKEQNNYINVSGAQQDVFGIYNQAMNKSTITLINGISQNIFHQGSVSSSLIYNYASTSSLIDIRKGELKNIVKTTQDQYEVSGITNYASHHAIIFIYAITDNRLEVGGTAYGGDWGLTDAALRNMADYFGKVDILSIKDNVLSVGATSDGMAAFESWVNTNGHIDYHAKNIVNNVISSRKKYPATQYNMLLIASDNNYNQRHGIIKFKDDNWNQAKQDLLNDNQFINGKITIDQEGGIIK